MTSIDIIGVAEATININVTQTVAADNALRESALLGETLYWSLPKETLNRLILYLTHKISEDQKASKVAQILAEDDGPAFIVQYPDGETFVADEENVKEIYGNPDKTATHDHDDASAEILDEGYNE